MRVFLAAFLALALAPPAAAQQGACGPFEEFRDALENQFSERQVGGGIMAGNEAVIMLFSGPEGATWTMLAVNTQGVACILGVGTDWDHGPLPEVPGRGA
jgi:hypothetical protein